MSEVEQKELDSVLDFLKERKSPFLLAIAGMIAIAGLQYLGKLDMLSLVGILAWPVRTTFTSLTSDGVLFCS